MTAQQRTTWRPAPTYGDARLRTLQRSTFRYFWEETNPENGLIPDNTSAGDAPASIAGVGLALASYPVAAEHAFVPRARAVERTLTTLRFLWNAPQGPMPDATGYHGFFTISSMPRLAGAPGDLSCRRSIQPSSSPAH
jgi:hypothetical protein